MLLPGAAEGQTRQAILYPNFLQPYDICLILGFILSSLLADVCHLGE